MQAKKSCRHPNLISPIYLWALTAFHSGTRAFCACCLRAPPQVTELQPGHFTSQGVSLTADSFSFSIFFLSLDRLYS